MEIIEIATQGNIQPIQRQDPYSTITYNSINIRVRTQQFQQNHAIILFLWGLCIIMGTTIPLCLIQLKLNLGLFPFFVGAGIGFIPLNVLVCYYYRKMYSRMLITWSLLTNICLLAIGSLLILGEQFTGVSLSIYCCMEVVMSCWLMVDKGYIIIKALLYFQLVVIGFRLDGVISVSWGEILFGFAIIFIFLCVVVSLLLIYVIAGNLIFEDQYFSFKRRGAIFYCINLLWMCSFIGSVLWNVYINEHYRYPLLASCLLCWATILYTFPNLTEITLSLCKHIQKIKQKTDATLYKYQNTSIKSLYRVSSNWMITKCNSVTDQQYYENEQCVVCMTKRADTTWMPCGHCTLCFECAVSLVRTNPKCVLCKQHPQSILRIQDAIYDEDTNHEQNNQVTILESYLIKY